MKKLLTSNQPGKELLEVLKRYPTFSKNMSKIKVFDRDQIDPLTFLHLLSNSPKRTEVCQELGIDENKVFDNFRFNFYYVKFRDVEDSDLLWKLVKEFSKDNIDRELIDKALSNVYSFDIEALSTIAHLANPDKFRLVTKIERVHGYTLENYLSDHQRHISITPSNLDTDIGF